MRSRRAAVCAAICLGFALISVVIAVGSDRLAPRVSITEPENAATIQGSADLNVTYVSASGQPIVRVDIWVDDGRMISYKLKEPVQKGKTKFRLHTQELTDGEHALQAQVFDAAGHAGQAQITVHVQNEGKPAPVVPETIPSGPDLIPPTVTVRTPQNGARVSGRVQVSVEATDDTKVLCVLLFVDDEWAAIQNYAPYNFDIQTTKMSEGVHTTYACAYDPAQNKGESARVYFTVDNARATTPSPEPLTVAPTTRPRGPESIDIGSGAPETTARAPELDMPGPAPEPVTGAATSTPAPAPELAAFGRPLPATERMASAPRLVMPRSIEASAAKPAPPVTSRAVLRMDRAPVATVGAPQRTQMSLLGPKTTLPAAPPAAERVASVSRSTSRMEARTSESAHAPSRSGMSSGQIASLPALPAQRAPDPVSSYSSVRTAPRVALPGASSPSRTIAASGFVTSPPTAPAPVRSAVAQTDRAERYAMLPRNVVTVASPKRDTAATESGQRVSSPGGSLLEAKHIVHLGGKSVPVAFDDELLRLRTLATERAGIPVGPFREIFEHTGGVVHWYPVDKRVTAYSGKTTVELRIGQDQAKVDNETVWLELAPFIQNGRTMVSFKLIQKVLDVTVKYDPENGRIQITSNKF